MVLKCTPVVFAGLVLGAFLVAGCSSGNISPSNPLDALSMSENEDEFVTMAQNNLLIMSAGANNFDQLFAFYKIGTLSGDANSQKFMQQFRFEYQGFDNLIGTTYSPGLPTQLGAAGTKLGKEFYHYNLKNESLLAWRANFLGNLFGYGRSDDSGELYDLQEHGYYLIESYDKGDYSAANRYADKFRTSLSLYTSTLARSSEDLRTLRP